MLKISVLTVEDYAVFRNTLHSVLAGAGDCVEVVEAASLSEVLALARSLHPDLVFMQLRQDRDNGIAGSNGISGAEKTTQVVLVTHAKPEPILGAASHHAPGSSTNGTSRTDPLAEVCSTAVERLWEAYSLASQGSVSGEHPESMQSLTPREHEILELIGQGHRDSQIARRLSISRQTVRTHIRSLMRKFHIDDRLDLPLYASLLDCSSL